MSRPHMQAVWSGCRPPGASCSVLSVNGAVGLLLTRRAFSPGQTVGGTVRLRQWGSILHCSTGRQYWAQLQTVRRQSGKVLNRAGVNSVADLWQMTVAPNDGRIHRIHRNRIACPFYKEFLGRIQEVRTERMGLIRIDQRPACLPRFFGSPWQWGRRPVRRHRRLAVHGAAASGCQSGR